MDDQNQTNQPIVPGTVPVAPSVPEDITPVDASVTTTTTTTTVAPPTAPSAEPIMPDGKPKKKMLPIIGGIAALLLVVGVAGASYYVSNQLSTKQAVAPNAPESEPMATSCYYPPGTTNSNGQDISGYIDPSSGCVRCMCPGETSFRPVQVGTCDSICGPSNDDGGGGGGGTTACVRGGTPACYVSAPSPDVCTQTGFKSACGWECCSDTGSVCCCQGCFPAGTDCSLHACAATATCDETKRDTPITKEITFAKSGSVIPFMRNPGYSGTITLSKTGSTAISIPFSGNGAAQELTPFTVTAGDVYTIKVVITSDAGESYGWIPNKSANICGPVKAPGASLDSNNKATGFCGSEVDITALKTLAAKTDMTGITAGGSNASVQCWADAMLGDATQDYDFEDYTIAFGYAQSSVGSCSKINIYKKVGSAFSPTALTVADLQKLKVGDVLMLYSRSNNENLKGRFKISIDGVEGQWVDGTIDGSDKTVHSYSYTIAKAGTYKFEAQVTTVP